MDELEWSWFESWDNTTLIDVALTAREMALLRSAVSFIENESVWSSDSDYQADVDPALELLNFTIADDQ